MDGQNIETVHNQSTSIRRPQALTIDYDNQILYWSDGSLDKILWSQVEPESEIKNYSNLVFQPKGLVITGRYLFFTDNSGVHIHSVNGTENNVLFHRYSDYYYYYFYNDHDICKSDFYGIDVISEQRQAQSEQMYTCNSIHKSYPTLLTFISTLSGRNPCESNTGGCGAMELCLLSSVDPRGYSCVESVETQVIPTLGMS